MSDDAQVVILVLLILVIIFGVPYLLAPFL